MIHTPCSAGSAEALSASRHRCAGARGRFRSRTDTRSSSIVGRQRFARPHPTVPPPAERVSRGDYRAVRAGRGVGGQRGLWGDVEAGHDCPVNTATVELAPTHRCGDRLNPGRNGDVCRVPTTPRCRRQRTRPVWSTSRRAAKNDLRSISAERRRRATAGALPPAHAARRPPPEARTPPRTPCAPRQHASHRPARPVRDRAHRRAPRAPTRRRSW